MKEVNAAVSSDANYGLKMEEDKDNNNNYYYYSNYQSKYFPDKNEENIECTNFNLNANDFNIDDIPVSVRDLLKSTDQTQTPEELGVEGNNFDSINTSDNDEKGFSSNHGDYVTICKNNNHNEQPKLVSQTPPTPSQEEDDNVYVIWTDQRLEFNSEIFFTVSHDNGQTFSIPQDISNTGGGSFGQQMLVSGNNVYVVWRDQSNGGDQDIFFTVSHDNGQTFLDKPIDLSDNDGDSANQQMLVSGNNVYVVWTDRSNGGDGDIFFTVSHDNGQTFLDKPIDLSDNDGDSTNQQMLVSGNNVYVVWTDRSNGPNFDIFFTVSHDNGDTFALHATDLSDNDGISLFTQMLVSGNNVYVVWQDRSNGGDQDIFFTVSHDNGDTFALHATDLSDNDGESFGQQMLVSGNSVYVVWRDESNGLDG